MENKRPTQAQRVLAYLQKNNSIDFMRAWDELGISRLSARIFEVENDMNVPITRTNASFKAKDGTVVSYVKYSI